MPRCEGFSRGWRGSSGSRRSPGCSRGDGPATGLRLRASEAPPPAADPAEELRRKLSETRATTDEPAEAAQPAPPTETLEERRSRVHAKAQEAIQAMQDPPS